MDVPALVEAGSARLALSARRPRRACARAGAPAVALLAAWVVLAGCASVQPSVPGEHALRQGVALASGLPEQLPAKSAPFPHAQFVLLPAESAAGLLMPIPFVGEAIGSALDASAAASAEARYSAIDPYRIVAAAMAGSPLLAASKPAVKLQTFAFVQECVDDRWRLALVAHLQGAEWVGRYLVHLPTTYSAAEYAHPTPAVMAALAGELDEGARRLRQLVERAARGGLGPSGTRADVGSLHLVGGKAAGLVSPTLLAARNVDVIEEGPEHVLVRIPGDMTQPASAGGLFFGVHWLRKDQLHTFRKLPARAAS